MSTCTLFFHGVSGFAHQSVLGVAAMCGESSVAVAQGNKSGWRQVFAPPHLSADIDTDKASDVLASQANETRGNAAEPEFVPMEQTQAGTTKEDRLAAETGAAEMSGDIVDPQDPPSGTPGDGDGSDVVRRKPGTMHDALLSRGGLTLSGGFSSVEGPNFEAKIARRHLGGFNRELTASARYSKVQTLFQIGYADGSFLGTSIVFAPTLFANRLSASGFGSGLRSTPFREAARGINFHFNRSFENGLSATANYRLSNDSFRMQGKNALCDASVFGSPVCGALGKRTSSILSLALTLDRRDSATDPTRGFKLRLTQDLAGLGGSTRYTRTRFGGEAHIGLGGEWKLSIGAEAGIVAAFGKGTLPLFDRFYVGGTSIRGFDLRGVGPKVRPAGATPGRGTAFAVGGRVYYAVRAQLTLPVRGLLGRFGLEPCAFVDAGSVFGASRSGLASGETLIGNSSRPRVSVGFGLALNTPAGKLRIEFARPIIKQFGDRARSLSISFGAAI